MRAYEVKIRAYEVKSCAYEVKIRAYEVKMRAYEVKIRAYEVKISAYEVKSLAHKSRHGSLPCEVKFWAHGAEGYTHVFATVRKQHNRLIFKFIVRSWSF